MRKLVATFGYALLAIVFLLLGTIVGQLSVVATSSFLFPGGRRVALASPLTAAWLQVALLVGPAIFVFAFTALWVRFKERNSPFAFLPSNQNGLFYGFAVGSLMWVSVLLISWVSGGIGVEKNWLMPTGAIPLLTLIGWAFQSFSEEYVFRGWLLARLRVTYAKPFAVLASAAIFSIVHGLNPDTSLVAYLNLFLAGVWFALLAIRCGGILAPALAHFVWNWTETSGIGLPSLGDDPSGGALIDLAFTQPNLWTGPGTGLNDGYALTLGFLIFILVELRGAVRWSKN
ncbi:CPBP family intramembrane glutamic endopeptidase [Aquidulcibacter sp.]|uniref:CPBP family intramembrane glutamic endopeptidase n=1 Tax=Aquidulcibacter sp. TaxID=2052990 RepID=UPI0025C06EED|nr:type II CAAX endopeptidase family protein [Aquidulcibacter sp.]MCA3693174.1 CPBP family intramembrane metalloprotease [Aquidulcibacter sp.]